MAKDLIPRWRTRISIIGLLQEQKFHNATTKDNPFPQPRRTTARLASALLGSRT
jgi:hypothetical protein